MFCAATLTWGYFCSHGGGGVTGAPLQVDAAAEAVELFLFKLVEPFNVSKDGPSSIRVTQKANGFALKWRVAFQGISGDISLIQANGDLLVGSGVCVCSCPPVMRGDTVNHALTSTSSPPQ